MTKQEYDVLNELPVELVSLVHYYGKSMQLKPGEYFTGVKKITLGNDDYSILDVIGNPHSYEGCNLKTK